MTTLKKLKPSGLGFFVIMLFAAATAGSAWYSFSSGDGTSPANRAATTTTVTTTAGPTVTTTTTVMDTVNSVTDIQHIPVPGSFDLTPFEGKGLNLSWFGTPGTKACNAFGECAPLGEADFTHVKGKFTFSGPEGGGVTVCIAPIGIRTPCHEAIDGSNGPDSGLTG